MALSRLGLRSRLVVTTVAAAVVAVAVLVVGLQALLARQSSDESLSALRNRADAAATTVRVAGGRVRVLDAPADSLDQNLWIYAADGTRVDGSAPPTRLRAAVRRLAGSRDERSVDVDGRYRLLARPVGGGRAAPAAVVVAGLDLAPYESAERRSLWLSLVLGLLTVVAAGAAAYLASGSALAQVRRMARRADQWREHDLTGRFELGTPRDELTELGDTLDRMLDRITQAIRAERRLTDEVAHELRTPLTVIRSEAQLALLEPDPTGSHGEPLAAIVAATDRMTASIDTMLTVARSVQADEQDCRAGDVLEHAAAHTVTPDGVSLRVDPVDEPVLVAAPLEVVVATLAPLLDNAARHATSTVHVRVAPATSRVEVHVEDDGAGVGEDDLAHIFEAGHTTADGSGLGLALARRLAHSVGGEVDAHAAGHGHFVLSLPRTRPDRSG